MGTTKLRVTQLAWRDNRVVRAILTFVRWAPAVVLLVVALVPGLAYACTLLAVPAEKAQLKVYFTKFVKEDTSGGKYKSCRIVTQAEKDTTTFFITPFRQDATLVVHESNWPKR